MLNAKHHVSRLTQLFQAAFLLPTLTGTEVYRHAEDADVPAAPVPTKKHHNPKTSVKGCHELETEHRLIEPPVNTSTVVSFARTLKSDIRTIEHLYGIEMQKQKQKLKIQQQKNLRFDFVNV